MNGHLVHVVQTAEHALAVDKFGAEHDQVRLGRLGSQIAQPSFQRKLSLYDDIKQRFMREIRERAYLIDGEELDAARGVEAVDRRLGGALLERAKPRRG